MRVTAVALLVTIAGAATIGPVQAADASRFDGYYGGFFVGYGGISYQGFVDGDEIEDGDPEEAEIFSGDFETGWLGGGYMGMNLVHGAIVYGVELSATTGAIEALAIDDGGNDYATQELQALIAVSARAGFALTDTTLLYGGAGIGLLSTKFTAFNDMDDIDAEQGSANYVLPGLLLSAGIEQALTDTLSVRLQGAYFIPYGERVFEDDELTGDMNAGDNASAGGVFTLTAGLTFAF